MDEFSTIDYEVIEKLRAYPALYIPALKNTPSTIDAFYEDLANELKMEHNFVRSRVKYIKHMCSCLETKAAICPDVVNYNSYKKLLFMIHQKKVIIIQTTKTTKNAKNAKTNDSKDSNIDKAIEEFLNHEDGELNDLIENPHNIENNKDGKNVAAKQKTVETAIQAKESTYRRKKAKQEDKLKDLIENPVNIEEKAKQEDELKDLIENPVNIEENNGSKKVDAKQKRKTAIKDQECPKKKAKNIQTLIKEDLEESPKTANNLKECLEQQSNNMLCTVNAIVSNLTGLNKYNAVVEMFKLLTKYVEQELSKNE